MASSDNSVLAGEMFRPPLARGMQTLDRSVFKETVQLKAARIFDNKNISKIRKELERSKDALAQDRIANVYPDPDVDRAKAGKKCILLRPEMAEAPRAADASASLRNSPEVNVSDRHRPWPHSNVLAELVRQSLVSVIPYNLHLTYEYWTYHDIISAILPVDLHTEIPSGFSQIGHVVHLNLREAYHPYKHLIASILIDKNPGARTVINKIDDVGEDSEYRTFKYEVLAGDDDMQVTVSEAGCEFSFDYSKVYWNPRLSTEHRRLVDTFREGEAVCDVMAGIGPFAVPAAKKRVFVWANDLNPDSFASLKDAVKRNKVQEYVTPSCADGRAFIRNASRELLGEDRAVEVKRKLSRQDAQKGTEEEIIKTITQPKVFQHYVLNLPASALTFLPSFVGLYAPDLRNRLPETAAMPLIHVYCFSTKDELESNDLGPAEGADGTGLASAIDKICTEISMHLGYGMRPGKTNDSEPGAVEIWDVRDVAPKKRMFCASFRLPEEVAFRTG